MLRATLRVGPSPRRPGPRRRPTSGVNWMSVLARFSSSSLTPSTSPALTAKKRACMGVRHRLGSAPRCSRRVMVAHLRLCLEGAGRPSRAGGGARMARSLDMPRAGRSPHRGCWRGLTRSTLSPGSASPRLQPFSAPGQPTPSGPAWLSSGPAAALPDFSPAPHLASLRSPVIRGGGGGQSSSWGCREEMMYIAWHP